MEILSQMKMLPALLLVAVLSLFLIAGLIGRLRDGDYYILPKHIMGRIGIGAAIASNWMSAASFLGVAGAFYLYGYFGLAFVVGWTGGYVLLLVLMARQLRRFGKYTAPDFVEGRYGSRMARLIAALITILICVIYCAAQYQGIALVFSWIFGVGYREALVAGALAAIGYLVLSGTLGAAKRQQLQCKVLLLTFLIPLMMIAAKLGFNWIVPQVSYGAALHELGDIAFWNPWLHASPYQWIALCFTLMAGTAGLPHVLSHFYTVPNNRDARWSVVWGLVFIGIVYLSAPAYAVFARLAAERTGLAPDLIAAAGMADMAAIRAGEWSGIPLWAVSLVAVGAISAAFYTVSGLIVTGAGAFTYDIYFRFLRPTAPERERMWVAKGVALVIGLLVIVLALNPTMLIVQVTAIAFALAGNTLFPAFFLGIWWEGTNKQGIIAGMLTGVAVTFAAPLLGGVIPVLHELIPVTASALIGVPLVSLVTVIVSRLTPKPPESIRKFLRNKVHAP